MAISLPSILVDTREPHLDAGDAEDAVFAPCIFAPGQPRERPFADRIRLLLPSERVTLPEGDYAIRGARVAFERKSGPDMLATVFGSAGLDSCGEAVHNQDRFRAELVRARDARYDLFAIVSEEQPGWYFTEAKRRWARYGKAFDPFRLQDILMSFLVDLGIPTLYCASRGVAEVQVGTMLARAAGWAEGGKAWERRAREHGYAPRWYAGAMPLAGGDARAQVAAGAEEASDGRRTQEGSGGGESDTGGIPGDGVVPAQAVRQGLHGATASGWAHPVSRLPAAMPVNLSGGDDAAAPGEAVAHDAGEQGAEAGGARNDDGRQGDPVCCPPCARLPEGEAQSMAAAYGAPGDSDGGRGRAPPPETTASEGEGPGRSVNPEEHDAGIDHVASSYGSVAVADLPCRCGGLGLGVAGFHYRHAFGCCYGPAPRPCAVASGQERGSTDGSERVAVVALRDRLWRVQRLGMPGASPGFHVEGMVLRYWPVLTREPRRDLLGVAATSEEHARRRAARERPAAKARRGRAGA